VASNSYAIDATKISQGVWPQPKVFIGQSGPAFLTDGPSVAMPPSGDYFAVAYDQWASYPSGAESLDVAVVGPQNTVTKTYFVGSNDYSPSISTLPSDTGEFLLTYIPTAGSGSNNHVFGRIGTYN
jgi:hypothetical protein